MYHCCWWCQSLPADMRVEEWSVATAGPAAAVCHKPSCNAVQGFSLSAREHCEYYALIQSI